MSMSKVNKGGRPREEPTNVINLSCFWTYDFAKKSDRKNFPYTIQGYHVRKLDLVK